MSSCQIIFFALIFLHSSSSLFSSSFNSIANINSLNSEQTKEDVPFQVRETKDPKLLKQLLQMISQLVESRKSDDQSVLRAVIGKVEKVRNEPLSVAFKRHVKTLESQEVVSRLFLPHFEASALSISPPTPSSLHGGGGGRDPLVSVLQDGLGSCAKVGPYGRGIYFPCDLSIQATEKPFRLICCDVAPGKVLQKSVEADGALVLIEGSGFDSISSVPIRSKNIPALRENLVVRSHQQVLPRLVVSFTLHRVGAKSRIHVVSADGSGDHRCIAEALEAANGGDKIVLRPGVYQESLTISKDVHIEGVGAVTIEAPGTVVTLSSNCQLSGVNFRLLLNQEAIVTCVDVSGGSPTLAHCVILGQLSVRSGAQLVLRASRVHHSAGMGVFVTGRSTCLIEDCSIEETELCGVQVEDHSRGIIMNTSVSLARQNGIFYNDGAKGIIQGCDIFSNAFPGVALNNAADPVVSHNRIHHNERSGLVIAGKVGDHTLVEDNNICSNQAHGILVAKDVICTFQGNSVFDNRGVGIQVNTGAKPELIRCHLYNNREGGISITKGASAHVSECHVFANSNHGITVSKGSASVVIQGCDVFANSTHGIVLGSHCTPKLLNNRIYEQVGCGVFVDKKAEPTIEGNEIFSCSQAGILVSEEATAAIAGNTVHTNPEFGIQCLSTAISGSSLRNSNNITDNMKAATE